MWLNPSLKSIWNIAKKWISKKKPPGTILFLWTGATDHYFTILFSYWFSITTIKNAIVTQQKHEIAHLSYFY